MSRRKKKKNRGLLGPGGPAALLSNPIAQQVPGINPVGSNNRGVVRAALASYSFSGPLPPPELLLKYNDVAPNGADRIIQMAERQQEHRQDLEKTVVSGNVHSERRGQWMGFILCLFVLGLGSYLAYIGREVAGSVFVGTDLAALAGVFVYGKHLQRKELAEKNEQFKRK